jgi:hypothetical protein
MFSGLMPAMVTPFDERGEVDLAATEAVVERFIEAGVDGISPLGSTGSGVTKGSPGRCGDALRRSTFFDRPDAPVRQRETRIVGHFGAGLVGDHEPFLLKAPRRP